MPVLIDYITRELSIRKEQIESVLSFFDEEATVPFIARYRKDATGGLTETDLRAIKELRDKFEALEKRKITILAALLEKKIDDVDLIKKISETMNLTTLEDLYQPYKSERKTKAVLAMEKGMGKYCRILQGMEEYQAIIKIEKYQSENKDKWETREDFISDLQALWAHEISLDIELKNRLRLRYFRTAFLVSKKKKTAEDEQERFRDYYDYSEKAEKIQPHRISAIFRGIDKKMLTVSIKCDNELFIDMTGRAKSSYNRNSFYSEAIKLSWMGSFQPSLKNELLKQLKERAEIKAIDVFANNLESVLMAAPYGAKPVIAIDPGFRSGCKWVLLDASGDLKNKGVIYPVEPFNKVEQAIRDIRSIVDKKTVSAFAIGNGTAGRETLEIIKKAFPSIPAVSVNESGASVYSASETALEEFPDLDITFRGAVSIGRRLLDPLAELVKIDPEAIGVGQYQHDVNQKKLKNRLNDVTEFCVNAVGVNLNTASTQLLIHVSGLNKTLSKNIIDYRKKNGLFKNRNEILKVKGIGKKSYQLSAGFLKILNGNNPLDRTFIHPESYPLVHDLAKSINCNVEDLMGSNLNKSEISTSVMEKNSIGKYTLNDIIETLKKPERDPRESFEELEFSEKHSIEELEKGEILPGIITNITGFGVFVDIGVHQDGLVHISELADKFISDPAEVVSPGKKVKVKVLEADIKRRRISLSIKQAKEDNS